MKPSFVYVLKCEDECLYVGFTKHLFQRLTQHWTGDGAQWTKLHPPIEVIDVFQGTREDENTKTLELMEEFGSDKVRGGSWCRLETPKQTYKHAYQTETIPVMSADETADLFK